MKINILNMTICGSSSVCGYYTIDNKKRKHKYNYRVDVPEFFNDDYFISLNKIIEQFIRQEIGE